MNQADSERIAAYLENQKLNSANFEKADFLILNLCSVRQKAIDKVWGKINEIKKRNKRAKIILTGCILNSDRKKFLTKQKTICGSKPRADYILNITELPRWLEKIENNFSDLKAPQKNTGEYFDIQTKYSSPFLAYVPIMTGCNNFCTYCAVPYTRGREKSRPAKDVIKEVNKLIVQGYKHIILLGQNVNSYKDAEVNFTKLIKKIDKIPGNYWLSFLTSHPKDLSEDLIMCFKKCKHLIPYLHLPIQAGSDKILKAMNRNYTAKHYLKLINKIKKLNLDINLSTDIIVGFPGETKNDFKQTIKIFKQVKYGMAFINQYSPREGTLAAKMKNNVLLEEKKRRDKELNEILKKIILKNNKKMVGKEVDVLIENFKNIKINNGNKNLIGKIVKIKIIKANIWNLEGKLLK